MTRVRRRAATLASLAAFISFLAGPAAALEWADGRVQLHGFWDVQLRWLSDDFSSHNWYQSQWANLLDLELELDIAPNGFGPFDLVTGFARVELRFECIYTGCGLGGTHRYFGDRATRAPAANWRNGLTSGFVADTPGASTVKKIHEGRSTLLTIRSSPILEPLVEAGGTNLDATLAPVDADLFAFKAFDIGHIK